jgi:hypothetical protein
MMFIAGFSLKPKICIDCKHFIPSDSNYAEFGKCSLSKYEIDKNDEKYLVTGIQVPLVVEYMFCSTMRSNEKLCGKEGKNYVKKYKKKY